MTRRVIVAAYFALCILGGIAAADGRRRISRTTSYPDLVDAFNANFADVYAANGIGELGGDISGTLTTVQIRAGVVGSNELSDDVRATIVAGGALSTSAAWSNVVIAGQKAYRNDGERTADAAPASTSITNTLRLWQGAGIMGIPAAAEMQAATAMGVHTAGQAAIVMAEMGLDSLQLSGTYGAMVRGRLDSGDLTIGGGEYQASGAEFAGCINGGHVLISGNASKVLGTVTLDQHVDSIGSPAISLIPNTFPDVRHAYNSGNGVIQVGASSNVYDYVIQAGSGLVGMGPESVQAKAYWLAQTNLVDWLRDAANHTNKSSGADTDATARASIVYIGEQTTGTQVEVSNVLTTARQAQVLGTNAYQYAEAAYEMASRAAGLVSNSWTLAEQAFAMSGEAVPFTTYGYLGSELRITNATIGSTYLVSYITRNGMGADICTGVTSFVATDSTYFESMPNPLCSEYYYYTVIVTAINELRPFALSKEQADAVHLYMGAQVTNAQTVASNGLATAQSAQFAASNITAASWSSFAATNVIVWTNVTDLEDVNVVYLPRHDSGASSASKAIAFESAYNNTQYVHQLFASLAHPAEGGLYYRVTNAAGVLLHGQVYGAWNFSAASYKTVASADSDLTNRLWRWSGFIRPSAATDSGTRGQMFTTNGYLVWWDQDLTRWVWTQGNTNAFPW